MTQMTQNSLTPIWEHLFANAKQNHGNARSLLTSLVVDYGLPEEHLQAANRLLPNEPEIDPEQVVKYELQCLEVIEHGTETASPALITQILLDPMAVLNIHMAVERDPSDF